MGTILSLAIHNHQPVGNFANVFESAYSQSYLPMLQALQRHPRVRVAMHYSGPLLDWLEGAHPEFFPLLRSLVDRAQVELMTGGYYEPILAIISDRDRRGQIRKMTAYLQRGFGARARGLWLAERVWEPHLPRSIAESGVDYTIVDDAHFLAAGLQREQLTGHFVTEEEGVTLKVFPSLHALRYLIPWRPVTDVLTFLRERASDPAPVLMMGDDGEKFGLWPGTFEHVWQAGWMEEFFTALEAEASWLQVIPPGEAAARPAAGRAYLPTASYDEMEEWALPVDSAVEYMRIRQRLEEREDPALRYLRGGFWRQFLVKYPEINTMHKKMLRVSEKVWRLPPGRRRLRALDEVWQAQCNCPYWHGVFGGVYLPHIRRANFAHIIAAEALADGEAKAPVSARSADLDADGAAEIELSSPAMVLWIDPAQGGGVVAWDWRAAGINLVNVLTRRKEAYHQQLVEAHAGETGPAGAVETIHTTRVRAKEPGLARLLVYDRYRRLSFLDHLLPPGATIEAFASGETVGTTAGSPYAGSISRSRSHAAAAAVRERSPAPDGVGAIRLEKRFQVDDREGRLRVSYHIANSGEHPVRALFGVETNWAITDPESLVRVDAMEQRARAQSTVPHGERIELNDYGWPGPVVLSFPTAAVWLMPLETVSNSEAGFERTFQGLTCVCLWTLAIPPSGEWETAIMCELPARS